MEGGTGSILWQGIFVVLMVELGLIAIICIPMPNFVKKPILDLIRGGYLDSVIMPLKWLFGLVLVLFLDAARRSMSSAELYKDSKGSGDSFAVMKDMEAKM